MREREIREIQASLLEGSSVRLVAPRETGRTYLLEQVATAMEARGFTAFRVTGRRAFRNQPYVALREAGLVSLRGAQSETDISDELAAELDAAARPIILVDDAEHLDLESAYLIEYSRARRDIPTVLSAPPFVMLDAQGRAATNKIRTEARFELAPLGYAQISLLAQRVLGAPAQPEVLSRVLAMSSGFTGMAVAILRSAAREGKIVRQESGWALVAESLWNVHLRSSVEQLIFGLERDEFRALHALALAESVVVERFHAIASKPLIGLAQHGLLTTFADTAGVAHVAPRPSLITDYFQHQPIDPLHYEALALLCELGDTEAQERAGAGATEMLSRAETFDRAHNHGTGIARFQRAASDTELASSAREWRSDPSNEHAVAYLDRLITTEGYITSAEAVFERTTGGGGTPMAIRLGMHRLFWDTQANRQNARARLREAVAAETNATARLAFEAFEAYLIFSRMGMDPEVEAWWQRAEHLNDGFSLAIRHFIGVISGRIHEELPLDRLDSAHQLQFVIAGIGNTITRSRNERPDEYERELRAEFAAARATQDYRRITISAYFLAQQEAATFRDLLATETVSATFAIGTPSLAYADYFLAQLRWAAYLHYLRGEAELARSVLAETARYPGIFGPLPAMHPEFATAVEMLVDGDSDGAVELLLRIAMHCREVLLPDAAWTYAVIAFIERPTLEVFAQLEQVADASTHGQPDIMQLVRRALEEDPDLPKLAQRLSLDAEISTSISLLSAILRKRPAAANGGNDQFAELLGDTIRELRALLAADVSAALDAGASDRNGPQLTKREREVSMLAATMQNREIADRLSLSVRTVENHLARAMRKLGVGSRAELAPRLAPGVPPRSGE